MRVLHVCAEVYPLLKTGGLADVAAALPPALARLGCDCRLLVPGFPAILAGLTEVTTVAVLPTLLPVLAGTGSGRLLRARMPDGVTPVYVIDVPHLYARAGNPYAGPDGIDYADNHRRFALLGRVAAELAHGLDGAWRAELVHGHDWHAGLAPAYLRAAGMRRGVRPTPSVFTVHNLAYQGNFPAGVLSELDLPQEFFAMEGLEFHGQVSFLKAGLYYADRLTTVSPSYGREIQTPAQGCGLEGLLRYRGADLYGILNGVDAAIWSPAVDPHIAAAYSVDSRAGKQACKTALQAESGLTRQNRQPLFGVVSRLTGQKGLHLLLEALPQLLARGGQLVILGSGESSLEDAFLAQARAHPDAVSVQIGYDDAKAHRIIAGGDVIVVPSLFEPCGLTQLYGLAYGTLPLVRRIGGLADTVTDVSLENLADGSGTGFVFDAFNAVALEAALRRAYALFAAQSDWQRVQGVAMRQKFDWAAAAARYIDVYASTGLDRPRDGRS